MERFLLALVFVALVLASSRMDTLEIKDGSLIILHQKWWGRIKQCREVPIESLQDVVVRSKLCRRGLVWTVKINGLNSKERIELDVTNFFYVARKSDRFDVSEETRTMLREMGNRCMAFSFPFLGVSLMFSCIVLIPIVGCDMEDRWKTLYCTHPVMAALWLVLFNGGGFASMVCRAMSIRTCSDFGMTGVASIVPSFVVCFAVLVVNALSLGWLLTRFFNVRAHDAKKLRCSRGFDGKRWRCTTQRMLSDDQGNRIRF